MYGQHLTGVFIYARSEQAARQCISLVALQQTWARGIRFSDRDSVGEEEAEEEEYRVGVQDCTALWGNTAASRVAPGRIGSTGPMGRVANLLAHKKGKR